MDMKMNNRNKPTETKIEDKHRIDYAIGVLETINFLIEASNEDLLRENIDHVKRILPAALNQLKSISQP
jgi:hypothetical protein